MVPQKKVEAKPMEHRAQTKSGELELSPEEEWILKMPESMLNRHHGDLTYSNLVQQ